MKSAVFFDPWIGANYGKVQSLFKRRILVLGGSHYCNKCKDCGDREKNPLCSTMTEDVICDYLDPAHEASWKKTFTSFINSILGTDSSLADRENVLNSVAFYNWLQVAAGDDPYSAGQYDYEHPRHLSAFYEVLDKTEPDVVISWGKKVWEALPNDWNGQGDARRGPAINADGQSFNDYQVYPYKGREILLIGVRHPSVGYGRDRHHEIFSQLIF